MVVIATTHNLLAALVFSETDNFSGDRISRGQSSRSNIGLPTLLDL